MVSWPWRTRIERGLDGLDRRQDADVEPGRVVVLRGTASTLAIRLRVVARASRRARRSPAWPVRRARRHGQLHPVADRQVLRPGTCARRRRPPPACSAAPCRPSATVTRTVPAVAISNVLSCEPYSSACCAIRPTFDTVPIVFGRRRRHASGSRRSWPGRCVGVAAVRNHGLHVVQLAVGAPHLARRADGRRHRRVDDHVARHVQVGDALARIHHRQRRARRVDGLQVGLDGGLLIGRQRSRSWCRRRRGRCRDRRRARSNVARVLRRTRPRRTR